MRLPQIVEKNGVRVLTTRQLTEWYHTEEWQIKQNFTPRLNIKNHI